MTKIFIPAISGDTDSILLLTSLESRGHSAIRWVGDNYPSVDVSSFFISNEEPTIGYVKSPYLELHTEDIDVVWLRRPRWPVLPKEVHPDDREIAEQECRQYIRSFYQASWLKAVWVNTLEGRRKANSKLLQLREAARIGLRIPQTVISNEPNVIRKFIEQNVGNVIVKALIGNAWKEDDGQRFCYTADINCSQLPSDNLIQACPAIYQKKIQKSSEVRAVFFGAEAIAIELDSQSSRSASLDWRIDPYTFSSRLIQIPENIYDMCRQLMRCLGILHGSFDFAIDTTGNWVFFEVNEAGQFLWMEDFVPETQILEIATQFFAAPDWNFRATKNPNHLTIANMIETTRFRELRDADMQNETSANATASI